MSKGKKRIGGLALAFAAAMAVFAAAGPTLADDNRWDRWDGNREWRWDGGNWRDHDGWRHDGWRNNWRHDGWRNNWRHDGWRWGNNWGPGWGNGWRKRHSHPNFVFVYPQPYYYQPRPYYYAPQPYYYQPRRYYYDYYGRPSFNFVFPLDLD